MSRLLVRVLAPGLPPIDLAVDGSAPLAALLPALAAELTAELATTTGPWVPPPVAWQWWEGARRLHDPTRGRHPDDDPAGSRATWGLRELGVVSGSVLHAVPAAEPAP